MNTYEELKSRGFIQQQSDEQGIQKLLNDGDATCYVGFDPTADSMHVGHLLPIMAMAHAQKSGNKAIALIGGGTTMIGDPSGKTEMRKILAKEEISANGEKMLQQFKRFLSFSDDKGQFVNNADWLIGLNYIDFLRDIGRYFRVNEMIKMEAYKLRLAREEGLSFLEFNYQLLQAYDYLQLFEKFGCRLQMGGDDQWGNILAGVDLIRKVKGETAYALTFPLLTTATGNKMGKTESGAVWLDAEKTSPYEYYQYWINTDDRDVERFLAYFTFLAMDEIRELCREGGEKLMTAKEVLAFEATKLNHGEAEAEKAREASKKLFSGDASDLENIPTTEISKSDFDTMTTVDLLVRTGLCDSKSEAKKLIASNGAYADNAGITSDSQKASELEKGGIIMLRKGKKTYHKIKIV
ncbi:MAG: tyrosine--tRNA ligase [Candidatus Yanofskybacteria bacterium RIFOXYD1_FULL_44_17]|uniref:Tyrosine--tRNA ligase n=1 Tax=Candidatus Yanofskybacteria bacterium GW2011_GWE2_40_11 TaxID=1619033 RepID=A0A0G0QTQ8_9BACT|nr:MAG: Tyrosine-tRNA ligase [Candidatus Yanofskybacteria bacterium GW2011_GWE1_40_10]KKR40706.1 MAG: Tyrosine-tRNA ligase [Candidatus Yanofskybacteria bacterium GW2011_GWE2_40_11]OGN35991.1 MAG: tyrosine--tRNA ligase [Candidatus Yanofskybacteria bacterium RIFOXYA1_FULL_44_17]OGN36407.1 MAG: tyrosine--tRNA ligase [Candidatus Yanofskybacteria bacterium RIFOXYA2_FULL_45_28]OGN37414.1 MAG: tyrosine--tRNA ligase [Candidatus Yanofskybacteria bacterium RIFOXYB1_FULL_44_29]OGN37541.1 MAG: tyrosine--t